MQTRFDEVRQSLARVLAVALLGAEALRAEHQHAVAGDAPIAPGQQAFAHRFGQRRRIGDVEAQLHRRGHLVDVLPARSEEHTSELQSLMRISYAVFCSNNNTKSKPL